MLKPTSLSLYPSTCYIQNLGDPNNWLTPTGDGKAQVVSRDPPSEVSVGDGDGNIQPIDIKVTEVSTQFCGIFNTAGYCTHDENAQRTTGRHLCGHLCPAKRLNVGVACVYTIPCMAG